MFEYDHLPEGEEISEVRKELQELADFIAGKERLDRAEVLMIDSLDPPCVCVGMRQIYMPLTDCTHGALYAYAVIIHEMTHLVVQREWVMVDGINHWKAHGDTFKSHEKRILSSFGLIPDYGDKDGEYWCTLSGMSEDKDVLMEIGKGQYISDEEVRKIIAGQKFYAPSLNTYFHLSETLDPPTGILPK